MAKPSTFLIKVSLQNILLKDNDNSPKIGRFQINCQTPYMACPVHHGEYTNFGT